MCQRWNMGCPAIYFHIRPCKAFIAIKTEHRVEDSFIRLGVAKKNGIPVAIGAISLLDVQVCVTLRTARTWTTNDQISPAASAFSLDCNQTWMWHVGLLLVAGTTSFFGMCLSAWTSPEWHLWKRWRKSTYDEWPGPTFCAKSAPIKCVASQSLCQLHPAARKRALNSYPSRSVWDGCWASGSKACPCCEQAGTGPGRTMPEVRSSSDTSYASHWTVIRPNCTEHDGELKAWFSCDYCGKLMQHSPS